MAKRHHSSKRARHHEHMGMEEYERGPVKHHSRHHARHHSSSKESHGGSMDPEHYHAERRGLERAGYRQRMLEGHEYYAGMEPRRRQEMEDAGMIHEDPREIANLPQQVMIKPYPMTGPYMPEGLDDTIAGVDRQMDYDDDKRRATFYPKKV